ncbi:hypothetical protein MBM_06561 [Drepanopeziza brunnea f. sp. 'multigermtubi' MB_m1]|uniref:Uncharacterized protein n=1 Tax=Marssonina brunnea f. sp. multigermtubi (strain MB_m1) TaxID=1072389 RepID=K1WD70_MARBU|nr:uncharacterized protein MBM_06561 [Drepanopeziza brunnea f. sp. 'multigermtubi' MB_m1]EKD15345.1 hypothetical protein MBM_06561 [Drepanopeziza brunnea f. sp. 'multigermtubi' MB_m1]
MSLPLPVEIIFATCRFVSSIYTTHTPFYLLHLPHASFLHLTLQVINALSTYLITYLRIHVYPYVPQVPGPNVTPDEPSSSATTPPGSHRLPEKRTNSSPRAHELSAVHAYSVYVVRHE